MNILVTGGTGAIGQRLCRALAAQGHALAVLSRAPGQVAERCGAGVAAFASLEDIPASAHFDAIVNLAGERVIGPRWTAARKKILWDSRVALTERLLACLARLERRPKVLLNASAVGYYGDGGDRLLDESCEGACGGFGRELCVAWEEAAQRAAALGLRVCIVRIAPVLMAEAGLLQSMAPAFRLGLGARLGDGRQGAPWIHLQDLLAIFEFLLEREDLSGAFNGAAPELVDNRAFTNALARRLHRPAFLFAPAFLLRLAMGEMSELLLCDQKVAPKRLLEAGFTFRYATLEQALADIFP
jgi:uncharacterized protein (TIGR01777 family)